MAREPDKSARDNKSKTDDNGGSKGTAKTSTSNQASASGGTEKSSETAKQSLAEFQAEKNRTLQGALAKRTDNDADPASVAKDFASIWLPLRVAETEVLVPALEDAEIEAEKSAAVEVRIDIVNLLLADLLEEGAGSEQVGAKLDALSDALNAFVAASDKQRDDVSQASKFDQDKVGSQMGARFERAKTYFADLDEAIDEALDLLAPRCLTLTTTRQQTGKERSMARGYEDRDERGRFVSDEERGYSRGGGYREGRDENGRFVSRGGGRYGRYEDDDNGYRRQASRGREDDRYYGRGDEGRSHGGWYGDSEGHSEASRRGWRDSEHGDSGWYGDSQGHSQASRRGWQRSEHSGSGWYGDPEGHSEASRRGWEESHERGYRQMGSRYDDDSRRGGYEGRRSSRYEDLDDYEPRGRGHGGWSGDPEGHSEAARRGWANRR